MNKKIILTGVIGLFSVYAHASDTNPFLPYIEPTINFTSEAEKCEVETKSDPVNSALSETSKENLEYLMSVDHTDIFYDTVKKIYIEIEKNK